MPMVLNQRIDTRTANSKYVGRPTKFGNRHVIGYCLVCKRQHNRQQAVDAHRQDVMADPELQAEIRAELRGNDLVCWCAPLRCHAEVLMEIANAPPQK